MKRKIRNISIFIAIAAILVCGCISRAGEDTVTGDTGNVEDNVETTEEISADTIGGVEDNSVEDEAESVENSSEETENTQFVYEMNESFIVNFNEVFSENEVFIKPYDPIYETNLEMPECIIREEDIIGEFCEGFPYELQQLLVYHNDSIYNNLEESDLRSTYRADIENISNYDPADLPMTVNPPDEVCNYGLYAVDIDSDGVMEYIQERNLYDRHFEGYTGYAQVYLQTTVLEYNDEQGWNIIGQGTCPIKIARYANSFVLNYEGTKYILLGNVLVCRNEAYDEETFGDEEKPWNVMAVNRELAGYTLNEIYSREGEDIDYLAGLDLENLESSMEQYSSSDRAGTYCSSRVWYCGDWSMEYVYDWEREYDGKTYLYVVSDFSHMGGWPWHDLLLTVFEEGEDCMEAVKVYYFAAHYCLSLENVEYDTDWCDMCDQ